MKQKRNSVDQIIGKLRQADIELGYREAVTEVASAIGPGTRTMASRMTF